MLNLGSYHAVGAERVSQQAVLPHHRGVSDSAIGTHNVSDRFAMRFFRFHSEGRLGGIGGLGRLFSADRDSTSVLLAKRKKFVEQKNDILPGGVYHPNALTLGEFSGWLEEIRVNTLRAEPGAILQQLQDALDVSWWAPSEKDWGAVKTILSACTPEVLKVAMANATPRALGGVYATIFASLVETANTPKLPPRYTLSDQRMKHNHAGWNDETITLVKKLIDALNPQALATLADRRHDPASSATVLETMLRQAEYYSDTVEMPQALDDDATWLSYDEEETLIHYLRSALDHIGRRVE